MAEAELIVLFKGKDAGLSSTAGKLGSTFSKLGGAVKAGALIGGVALAGLGVAAVGMGSKLVNLGSDAQEMMGKFNIVFAETGDKVTSNLGMFADQVGRSKFELMGMASTFGDTLKPMGFTEEAAANTSITLTRLATDLGSFNNMPMDEALQRLQGTLIGSHENALAFGVIINENTLKAELAAQGWDKLTGAELEQAKVQARINLLMQGTTDAQGDAARTSGSWANQMRGLKASLTDAATELGLKLLPALTPVLAMVGELASQAVPILTGAFERFVPVLTDVANFFVGFVTELQNGQGVFDAIVEALLNWTQFGEDNFFAILDTVDALQNGLFPAIENIKNKILEFLDPVIAAVTEFVSWKDVLIALGIVIGGVVLSALISLASAIAPIIIGVGALLAVISILRNVWESDWQGIRTAVTDAWNQHIKPAMEALQAWMQGTLIPFIQNVLVPIFVFYVKSQIEFLALVWTNVLQPAIEAVWNWLSTVLIPFITGVLVPWLEVNIPAAIQALSDYWTNVLQPAIEAVWAFIQDPLIPLFEALWDLLSVVGEIVLTAAAGLWQNVLQPALASVWAFIQDNVMPILNELWQLIEGAVARAVEFITGKFGGMTVGIGGVTGAIQNLIGWIGTMIEKLNNIELPAFLTPGSPTPFELGLRGISDAMQGLSQRDLPALGMAFGGNGNSSTSNSTNNNVTFNVNTSRFDAANEGRATLAMLGGI